MKLVSPFSLTAFINSYWDFSSVSFISHSQLYSLVHNSSWQIRLGSGAFLSGVRVIFSPPICINALSMPMLQGSLSYIGVVFPILRTEPHLLYGRGVLFILTTTFLIPKSNFRTSCLLIHILTVFGENYGHWQPGRGLFNYIMPNALVLQTLNKQIRQLNCGIFSYFLRGYYWFLLHFPHSSLLPIVPESRPNLSI